MRDEVVQTTLENQRIAIQSLRWHLIRLLSFVQEIARDADPHDPKVQELAKLSESLVNLKV